MARVLHFNQLFFFFFFGQIKLINFWEVILKRHSPSLVCNVISIPLMSTYENNKGLTPLKKSIWQTFPSSLRSWSWAWLGLCSER